MNQCLELIDDTEYREDSLRSCKHRMGISTGIDIDIDIDMDMEIERQYRREEKWFV